MLGTEVVKRILVFSCVLLLLDVHFGVDSPVTSLNLLLPLLGHCMSASEDEQHGWGVVLSVVQHLGKFNRLQDMPSQVLLLKFVNRLQIVLAGLESFQEVGLFQLVGDGKGLTGGPQVQKLSNDHL